MSLLYPMRPQDLSLILFITNPRTRIRRNRWSTSERQVRKSDTGASFVGKVNSSNRAFSIFSTNCNVNEEASSTSAVVGNFKQN